MDVLDEGVIDDLVDQDDANEHDEHCDKEVEDVDNLLL